MFYQLLIIILIIAIIILLNYYYNRDSNIKESFDMFSPYAGNNSYPFVYEQQRDQAMLQKTLNNWEKPFNCHDEGYYNAEPLGNPPMVTICAFNRKNYNQY